MRVQKPCSTSGTVTYSAGTIDCLWNSSHVTGSGGMAGVAKDGSFGWLAKGSVLEVFNLKSGQRLAAWCFGAAIKDPDTLVTAICEFENDRMSTTLLVVATTTLNPHIDGGMICLFDVQRSAVVKAIQVPYEVTSLEAVAAVGPDEVLFHLFCQQVNAFCGIMAVGTQCGHLYLLDMCMDDCGVSNEQTPWRVEVFQSSNDLVTLRYQATNRHNHLCFELGGAPESDEFFTYRNANGSVQYQLKSSDVYISCLKFIKQTMTLLVGFTFGGFQLWNLRVPMLLYTSYWEENLPAVTHFAFQEPENDPRDYCYFWVVHGPTPSDSTKSTSSHASLYQLSYQNKRWLEEFGFLYENLNSLAVRFAHELNLDAYNSNNACQSGSRVISCYTLENHRFRPPLVNANETLPDEGVSPDRSLCLFVWEAVSDDEHVSNHCFLAIFDINRWYHAQLPSSLSFYRNQKTLCPYWSVCSLDEVMQNVSPDILLLVHVDFNDLNRFIPPFNSLSEKFLNPSALAFNAYSISESGIIISKFLGIQRLILGYVQKHGFNVLLDPNEIFILCVKSGLISTDSPTGKLTVFQKRESLLSMALDYNIAGFVTSCIRQLVSAEFGAEGFTMQFLTTWVWKKLITCKEAIDTLCTPLFDWSPGGFSAHDVKQLHYHQVLMRHLVTVFETLDAHSSVTTDQVKEELASRLKTAQLISGYLDIIIWFHAVGLLPEHPEEELLHEDQFAFPGKMLMAAYVARRQSIRQLSSNVSSSAILVIDELVNVEGASISKHFRSECGAPLYPPTSFQALIRIFLLPDVTSRTKLTVVLYLLQDLALLADFERANRMEEMCKQFCGSFHVSPSLYRHIQGIWLLDHQHFQRAATILLDAGVIDDIPPWQHSCILRAFLCQGHELLALKYMKVRRIPALTADDVKLKMTILLANGLTTEALDYQRTHRDSNLMEDLMTHMILACLETNTIGDLLNLSLTNEEESHLVKYLQNSGNPDCHKLLVLYYLQQSRLLDAINTNGHLKSGGRRMEKEKILDAVIDGYKRVLPSVQRKLGMNVEALRYFPVLHKEYSRPTPLSSAFHTNQGEKVITRAMLLNTVLDKVHELNVLGSRSGDTQSGLEKEHKQNAEQETVLFGTPIVPQSIKKLHMSLISDVIFPSSSNTTGIIGFNVSGALDPTIPLPNPAANRLYSASAMSILQTPPVVRHRMMLINDTSQLNPLPQSILSVKSQKKPSADASLGLAAVTGVLKFDGSDNMTPYVQYSTSRAAISQQGVDMTATPRTKTLRFMEPENTTALRTTESDASLSRPEAQPSTEHRSDSLSTELSDEYVEAAEGNSLPGRENDAGFEDENMNNSAIKPTLKTAAASSELLLQSYSHHQDSVEMEVDEGRREFDFVGNAVHEHVNDTSLHESGPAALGLEMSSANPLNLYSDSLHRPPIREDSLQWKTYEKKSDYSQKISTAADLRLLPEKHSFELRMKMNEISNPNSVTEAHDVFPDSTGNVRKQGTPKKMLVNSPINEVLRSSIQETVEDEENGKMFVWPRESLERRAVYSAADDTSLENKKLRKSENKGIAVERLETSAGEELTELSSKHEISVECSKSPSMETHEVIDSNPEQRLKDEAREISVTPTRRRKSFQSPSREAVDSVFEKSSQDWKERTLEQPQTPSKRRRSARSPGRDVIASTVKNQDEKELMGEQPQMQTRRRSVRSPGRDVIEPLMEELADNKIKEVTVEQPRTPTTRRSARLSTSEAVDSVSVTSAEAENEAMLDQPKMQTRSRSVRSPGREVIERFKEEPVHDKNKGPAVEQPNTPTRRRLVRSPAGNVSEPLMEETLLDEQHKTPPRRRSIRSPNRDVIEPLMEESTLAEQHKTPPRRRSIRSPNRNVIEPLMEESTLAEQHKTPPRRRSIRSPNCDVIEPLMEESTLAEQHKTPPRRRSIRSPNRDVIEPLMEESTLAEQHKAPPRRRSLRSPNRDVMEPKQVISVEKSFEAKKELTFEKTPAPTRQRSVQSPSREITKALMDESTRDRNKKSTVDKAETPMRGRSVQSPSRQSLEPLAEETAKDETKEMMVDQPRTPTRRRTVQSPTRPTVLTENTDLQLPKEETSVRRRFVRSPSRERVIIAESLTPVRRSLRQLEKLDKAQVKNTTTGVPGITVSPKKSPRSNKSSPRGTDQTVSNKESGTLQTPKVSKTLVLLHQETRKPLTRSEARHIREMELQEESSSVAVNLQTVLQSPGRSVKRRAVESKANIGTPVAATCATESVATGTHASQAVLSQHTTEARSDETTDLKPNRLFVFSAPLLAGDIREASEEGADPVSLHSNFVFSPPHTRLRDRLLTEQPGYSTEAETAATTGNDEVKRIAKLIKSGKAGRVPRPRNSVKMGELKRGKRSRVAKSPAAQDVPILFSPVSDVESSPSTSAISMRKRSTKSSYVTRPKRKKFPWSDPLSFW